MKKLVYRNHIQLQFIYVYLVADEYEREKLDPFTLYLLHSISFIYSIGLGVVSYLLFVNVIDFTQLYLTKYFAFLFLAIIVSLMFLITLIANLYDLHVSITNHYIKLLDTRYSLKRGVKKCLK